MPKPLTVAGSLALLDVAYRAFARPRLARWGATDDEARRSLPGDELLAVDAETSTMATTIDAPPADVWPWLLQMGCERAGWYSYDALDNAGRPSAEQLVPDLQRVSLGERLSSDPTGRNRFWFTIEELFPERALVLRASIDLRSGHSFEPGDERPAAFSDSTWAFVLEELPGGRTRLIVRSRSEARSQWRALLLNMAFGLPSHVIMQVRQFENLRKRAEAGRSQAPASAPHPAAALS